MLAGIVANAVLSAGVTFLKAVADDKLGAIVLWLMGSFSGASPAAARLVWLGAAVTLIPAWLCGRQLDAVSLGEGQGKCSASTKENCAGGCFALRRWGRP